MPINANFEFTNAEKKFYEAKTDEDRLEALEGMLSTCPSHKGAENLRINLKMRYKKLQEKIDKNKAKRKASKAKFSVKKGEMQAVLVGLTNSGKSSILKTLTNANPQTASYGFTTQKPEIGILYYGNCQIQLIDLPAIGADTFDTGIINTADTALLVVEKIQEIGEVEKAIAKFRGKRIVIFNKIDLYDSEAKRKIQETLKSKRYNFVTVSCKTEEGVDELKEKIFKSFNKIRIYTKQPGKSEQDNEPIVMEPNSTVENAARVIFHGKLNVIKRARIWGPSSKFGGQEIGIKHILKDKDILEFSTR